MPILYLKNNATTAKSVRPTGYTFPAGLSLNISSVSASYLIVAGGGGAGSGATSDNRGGGGGGAGGYLTGTSTLV